MTPALEQRIAASLAVLIPQYPGASLCIALSGGLDSSVLLHVLALLRRAQGRPGARLQLRAVHVNHGLLPGSARWADHCRTSCRRLHIRLKVIEVQVLRKRGESPEAAAREARYRALAQELEEGEVLLTAHHADDQLETVLLQLLRGAGLPGIAAMPAVGEFARGRLARPLLALERSEIEAWARARGLTWIEDDSNADERLDRNYLRRRIVPLLRARWPGLTRAAGRTARHAAEAQQLLDLLARADVERARDGACLSVKRLRTLSAERRRNALRFWIARSRHRAPDARRLAELAGPLIDARPDANPQVRWNDTVVQRQADSLMLRAATSPDTPTPLAPLAWPLHTVPVLELPATLGRLELARALHGPIDLEALPQEITVLLRRGGERLRPRRGGPRRALKDLLREAHVPHAERGRVPLLFDGEHLLAVGDLWVDARIRAGAATKQRARLIWHR